MSASPDFEVYFDFDNTITEFDVLDDMLQRFSVSDEWKRVEEDWLSGLIDSCGCLERQFSQVRISGPALREYLCAIAIDPAFRPIVDLLHAEGIEPVILSDSFASIITPVLNGLGFAGIETHCNEMRLEGDKPRVTFPNIGSVCPRCGGRNCKTLHLLRRARSPGAKRIYVGDGQSDICPAGVCEILFAKGSLLKHYAPIRKDCIPFENLRTVHARLQNLLK